MIDPTFKTIIESSEEMTARLNGITLAEQRRVKAGGKLPLTNAELRSRRLLAFTFELRMAEALYIAAPTSAHFANWKEARRGYDALRKADQRAARADRRPRR